jgi:hypothetical protein
MHVGVTFCLMGFRMLNVTLPAVLGVDLKALIQREFGDDPPPGAIPSMLETCFREVESEVCPKLESVS